MRSRVDAASEARHDDHPGPARPRPSVRRDCRAVGGARASADDRNARRVEQRQLSRATDEEAGRRVVDRREPRREPGIAARDPPDPVTRRGRRARVGSSKLCAEPLEPRRPRLVEQMRVGRRGEQRRPQARSSVRLRSAGDTRAPRPTCSGNTHRRRRARRSSRRHARPARDRGPRAAVAPPRVRSSSSAGVVRSGAAVAQSLSRSEHPRAYRGRALARRAGELVAARSRHGDARSKRSSSARESFSR